MIASFHQEGRYGSIILASPTTFIEVHVPRQKSESSYIGLLGESILSLSVIFIFDFGIVLSVWYFVFFLHFISIHNRLNYK